MILHYEAVLWSLLAHIYWSSRARFFVDSTRKFSKLNHAFNSNIFSFHLKRHSIHLVKHTHTLTRRMCDCRFKWSNVDFERSKKKTSFQIIVHRKSRTDRRTDEEKNKYYKMCGLRRPCQSWRSRFERNTRTHTHTCERKTRRKQIKIMTTSFETWSSDDRWMRQR